MSCPNRTALVRTESSSADCRGVLVPHDVSRFSLDDFGAGLSSVAYLKHLPIDFLRTDGGFVKDMANDPIDRAMVEAINSVGHVVGKQTIAEFVDSEQVIARLRKIGVDFAQGYGVANCSASRRVRYGFLLRRHTAVTPRSRTAEKLSSLSPG
jgi:EAL domain-containing protein (putative c-di-GMP-specific phosphodiesterase class I)